MQAWNCISEQAEKIQQMTEKVEPKRNGGGCSDLNDEKRLNCKEGASKNNYEKVGEIETEKKELNKNDIHGDDNNGTKQVCHFELFVYHNSCLSNGNRN